jgi:predicted dehydrogenase
MARNSSLSTPAPAPLTRRTFLKRSAQAAAAFGLPTLIPSTAFGAKGAALPSARLNVAVIGLGNQGVGHLLGGGWTYVPGGYVARDDVQVRAVCDVQRDRRERAQRRCHQVYAERFNQPGYRDVAAYNDFRDVLARADIDAVLLALPYHWHAPMAVMAMQAGKDVYCEKPIAITVAEAEAVVATARRYNRVYQAGTQQRSEYGGKFRLACDLIRNERLGQLREIYAYRLPGSYFPGQWTSAVSAPVPDGWDWDLWLGPLPWRPCPPAGARNILRDLLVGDVNWSPHHYDFVLWALNPDPARPVEIEYDRGRIRYHFASGVVVHSGDYPGEPTGGQGGACFVGSAGRLAIDRDRIVSYPAHLAAAPLPAGAPRVTPVTGHQENFLECVRTRRRPHCHPETAAANMATVLAGGIALGLQRSLQWDPARRRFSGDETANRLLSYVPRSPWQF